MNNFISSLYVWIDLVKSIGPIIIGIFGAWIAYGQFKLSKSQSKISQEQLALAKQQADIAQRKVELDIRDRKHDVFKRWDEVYYEILSNSINANFQDYNTSYFLFVSITQELQFVFKSNKILDKTIKNITKALQDIAIHKNKEKGRDIKDMQEYYSEIGKINNFIIENRKVLMAVIFQELLIR